MSIMFNNIYIIGRKTPQSVEFLYQLYEFVPYAIYKFIYQ